MKHRRSSVFLIIVGLFAALTACSVTAFVPPRAAGRFASATTQREEHVKQVERLSEFHQNELVPAGASVSESSWHATAARWVSIGALVGLLAGTVSSPSEAYTTPIVGKLDWQHEIFKGNYGIEPMRNYVEPCAKSKRFAKRIKDELYKVEQRQRKYPEGSVVYNRFVEKSAQIKRRQTAYGDRMCGKKDGIPRVLIEPSVSKGGIWPSTFVFFYITGWIGWAGRSYMQATKNVMKEVNMDVPLALNCMASGFAWPVLGWQSIVNGDMARRDKDIYVSPP